MNSPSSDGRTHRHAWKVARYETTIGGKLKEHLICKYCKAFKGRYVKVEKK